jgi:hypothetical protein
MSKIPGAKIIIKTYDVRRYCSKKHTDKTHLIEKVDFQLPADIKVGVQSVLDWDKINVQSRQSVE